MTGWKKSKLGNHIDLLTGFPFKSTQYTDSDISVKLLRGDNVVQGRMRWENVKRWPSTQEDELKKYQLQVDDLVIAMDRTWVKSGLKVATIKSQDIPCLLVQRVARLRSKSDLNAHFLPLLIRSHKFEQYVKGVQTETAVPHISAAQIHEFPILLPPLLEQTAIADLLSTWDAAIEMTEKLTAAKLDQRKGLIQQLLSGKQRFPEFVQSPERKEMRWGSCPVDWGVRVLETLQSKYPARIKTVMIFRFYLAPNIMGWLIVFNILINRYSVRICLPTKL